MTVEDALPSFPPPLADPTQPAPLFAGLRARCPVALVELPSGDRAWLVTRYEDIRFVHRNVDLYSSEIGGTSLEDLDEDQIEAIEDEFWYGPGGERGDEREP